MIRRSVFSILLLGFLSAVNLQCQQNKSVMDDAAQQAELLHHAQNRLTEIIVSDIFSPPVASRIYAYCGLAAYEVIKNVDSEKYPSIVPTLSGFESIPNPEKDKAINFQLASVHAFLEVAKKLVFSSDSVADYEQTVQQKFIRAGLSEQVYENSLAYGDAVVAVIMKRAATDMYKETRGYPRYTVTKKSGMWRPTAPEYMDAVEPWFGKLKPFILDSSSIFQASGPYTFSLDKNSQYYKDLEEVITIGNNLTESQKIIASFWDCNPYVGHHKGHLMYATKKITPGGHWIGIAGIACRTKKLDMAEASRVYAWLGVTLFDSFVSCWDEKYKRGTVRPETVINDHIDDNWKPFLQCPPFPDYPSGHSVLSAASALVLTRLIGDNFSFIDSVEIPYGIPARQFKSFKAAAQEAMISRLYGGIHFRKACEDGFKEGTEVGSLVVQKINSINHPDRKQQVAGR